MKSQPLIGPLAGLVFGILCAENFSGNSLYLGLCSLLLMTILVVCFRQPKTFVVLVFMGFAFLGHLRFEQYNRYQAVPDALYHKKTHIRLKIVDTYRSTDRFYKYKAQLLSIDQLQLDQAHCLLYLSKTNPKFHAGDILLVHAPLQKNETTKNPHQFDYSQFLAKKKMHSTLYVYGITEKEKSQKSIAHYASRFKDSVHQKLLQSGYSKESSEQISAMLLGDRTEMNRSLEMHYRKTGVVHILAISGLHVAMIYSIFYFLLQPIRMFKNGKKLQILLSILLIWAFVLLVGFHPPVLRAALMISVIHATMAFKRQYNIYHSLMIAAVILLLSNPNFLFDVGFQLSFSAVFFIVYLWPVFQKTFQPKNKFSKWIIGFLATCIAAQLGTLPFSLYYFHQTTALFLAGNIVMITAAFFMVAGGMLSILLVILDLNVPFWSLLFNRFVSICNAYIERLSQWDALVFEQIHLNLMEVLLLLMSFILVRMLILRFSFRILLFVLLIWVGFEGQRVFRQFVLSNKHEIIVFHHRANFVVGIRNGKELDLYLFDEVDKENIRNFVVQGYIIHEKIRKVNYFNWQQEQQKSYLKSINEFEFSKYKMSIEQNKQSNQAVICLMNKQETEKWMIVHSRESPEWIESNPEAYVWITDVNGAFQLDLNNDRL